MVKLASTFALGTVQLEVLQIFLLLIINNALSCIEIDLVRFDAARLGDDHVAKQHDDIHGDTDVARDEFLDVEVALAIVQENSEVLGDADEAAEEQSNHGAPVALGGGKRHGAVRDVLSLAGLNKV